MKHQPTIVEASAYWTLIVALGACIALSNENHMFGGLALIFLGVLCIFNVTVSKGRGWFRPSDTAGPIDKDQEPRHFWKQVIIETSLGIVFWATGIYLMICR